METLETDIVELNAKEEPIVKKSAIFAHQIHHALIDIPPTIKILSLDCFDTLLWRKTATPIDAFYAMQNYPAFKKNGFTANMRVHAEVKARSLNIIRHKNNEVNLRQIYENYFSNLTEEQITELENDEINVEMQTCYAFPLTVQLMQQAMQQHLKIIIVSDTYFRQTQLTKLLAHLLPADIFNYISYIFCSNEYGVSKSNGLFDRVLEKLSCSANEILHIGDNEFADLLSAQKKSIPALHLLHRTEHLNQFIHMYHSAATMMETEIRHCTPLENPFLGVFATQNKHTLTAEQILGYYSLGPIMYAFASFLEKEYKQLKKLGKKPKIFFMMRDAYLPFLASKKLNPDLQGKCIRISRFASYAASFCSKTDIEKYLAEFFASNRYEDMMKQFLLPQNMREDFLRKIETNKEPMHKFVQLIREAKTIQFIINASAQYRKRLLNYVKLTTHVEPGDCLVFVDLGYSGTTQRLLGPILEQELDVEIMGRYLISLGVPEWNTKRKGLLDLATCEDKSLKALVRYIALLEQLCTENKDSIIDYDPNGEPIFSETLIHEHQQQKLKNIQTECLSFIQDAQQFFMQTYLQLDEKQCVTAALAGIARLLFFPTQIETYYLQFFTFDTNMGTNETYKLYDLEKGLQSLRRRGLFSIFTENNKTSLRTNAPAELRSAGIELSIALLAQHRFALEFSTNDLTFRKQEIPVIVNQSGNMIQTSVVAQHTYDGYYSILIPIANFSFDLGIILGAKYEWIKIESAEIVCSIGYETSIESECFADIFDKLIFNKITVHKDGLLNCADNTSLVLFQSPTTDTTHYYIFRLVFRPVVLRKPMH